MTRVVFAQKFQNFDVALYARVYEVQQMKDLNWLKDRFDIISRNVHIDKVYVETHRDRVVADQQTIDQVKRFFQERGVKTSGGITITVNERNRFETYCYTNPEHRQKLKEVIEFTARNFDELILDDFFFTNCKCESCIKAKGDRSWTDFRLDLLTRAAEELILAPARAVNPKVKVIIKYPNWYEHFQGLGFNLESGPRLFDGLYTGTETRDASSDQHLQPYLGYLIFRFFDNLKPGANLGGWVDTGGSFYVDRYCEQLALTLFAKAPEITLFDFGQLLRPLRKEERAPWQGQATSFDFDRMTQPYRLADGSLPRDATIALAADFTFSELDPLLGKLGKPTGLKSYKPLHSVGEDYVQNYMGMLGFPLDLVPEFPVDEKMVLLTESAKFDPLIINKIKRHLMAGNDVVITSGLLRAMQDKGLSDIVELRYTDRKAMVKDFRAGWGAFTQSKEAMIIPQIQYLTNDSWEEISAFDDTNGWPILHSARYANGACYVWVLPENYTDLYHLPAAVLTRLKENLLRDRVYVESPAQVALFTFDNQTFVVESFLPETTEIKIIVNREKARLLEIPSQESPAGQAVLNFRGQPTGKMSFPVMLKPHSFRAFQIE
ncbi:MAG: hypothetical protein EHM72_12745 [Calditrichaeota bacterium]|nr:MAG: hypothetical protein EHM72_12745 [Calditrichota bacterium]